MKIVCSCVLFSVSLFLSGCGSPESVEQAELVPSPIPLEPVVPVLPTIEVLAVDIEGNPIPGMIAIGTLKANAFDRPVVQGPSTGLDGASTLAQPEHFPLFVRAWDPTFRYFANNYFTLSESPFEDMTLTVTMVAGSALACTIVGPDGVPLGDAETVLLLIHPERGPWWTARARTDATGWIGFMGIPSGIYDVALRTEVGVVEVLNITLQPKGQCELGIVTAHPEVSGVVKPD